jgi:hypothetical protein
MADEARLHARTESLHDLPESPGWHHFVTVPLIQILWSVPTNMRMPYRMI